MGYGGGVGPRPKPLVPKGLQHRKLMLDLFGAAAILVSVMSNIDQIPGVPSWERVKQLKEAAARYPKSDWSEGSYNDIFRKAADAKRKKYGTACSYNGY